MRLQDMVSREFLQLSDSELGAKLFTVFQQTAEAWCVQYLHCFTSSSDLEIVAANLSCPIATAHGLLRVPRANIYPDPI